MKKIIFYFLLVFTTLVYSQQQTVTYNVAPIPFEETNSITITFNGSSINEATWGVTNNALYLWSWSYDLNLSNLQDCPTNGTWGSSNEANRLTYNSGSDTYSISFVPSVFYNRTNIGRIGFLIKAKDGTGDKKSQDILVDVGSFQVVLNAPSQNSTTILNSGDNLNIDAVNTGGNANYVLKANGSIINSQNNTSSYTFTDTNITANKNYELEVTLDTSTITKSFSVLIDPGTTYEVMSQNYEDGINYISDTEAILVLFATGKDFVYVAGSFNNWQPNSGYAMKRDPTRNNKFWIQLNGLTPGQIETYQYWVVDKTPPATSPKLVKTADPYSTLVLSPFDDPFIPASTYPNLPTYPAGQEREVTVLQTAQTPYDWQVTNFAKPKKEDLIVYEVLIRDFDANRNFQDLIDRIDYFKNLNINAIQLMPVMEFEGNESWGYNTAFHMALDKFYGTEEKFKEFIDLCHQNGIAVILDIALNHAFGRNPMVRMWMSDPDGDGWGDPIDPDNPYFNAQAKHSYSVGSDFDHSNARTKDYVKRVIKHWIQEFNIDGFRWDLTKGFTQCCSAGDESGTNAYQADRVAILKEYADYSWTLDPTHYVIFEHLGSDNEEQQWANYRLGEGKGIMMWGKMTDPYNQLTMGYASNSNINRMGHEAHGFSGKRVMGYAESHDEERLMYKNLQFGNTTNGSHNVTNLNTALSRMSALGAVSLTIPGPKMIWHFAELGMENSIFTCNNGTVNEPGGTDGDCKLDTKPQPQWVNNWIGNTNRNQIYNDWSRINDLKINEPVFEGNYTITSGNLTPRIDIYDTSLPTTQLRNVIVLANFDVVSQNVSTNFPTSGVWYDLMDPSGNTTINASVSTVNIEAGGFRIYGNQASTLSLNDFEQTAITIYPNPVNTSFKINKNVSELYIYDITGKLVKEFKGDFISNVPFDISDLTQSMYLIKIRNNQGQEFTSKLIKL